MAGACEGVCTEDGLDLIYTLSTDRTLRSFDPRSAAYALDVDDPYYGNNDDFEDVYAVIEAALPGLHAWVDEQLDGQG